MNSSGKPFLFLDHIIKILEESNASWMSSPIYKRLNKDLYLMSYIDLIVFIDVELEYIGKNIDRTLAQVNYYSGYKDFIKSTIDKDSIDNKVPLDEMILSLKRFLAMSSN